MIAGTVHVLPIEDEIKDLMSSLEGWHVAIELDKERLKLMTEESVKNNNVEGPFTLKLLYKVERFIAKKLGEEIGVDMISAYNVAKELHMEVSLIDIPISITIRRLASIPTIEKLKLLIETFLMPFTPISKSSSIESFLSEDTVLSLVKKFKKRYPMLYKILVEDRDRYLFNRILELEHTYGNVIAFVGAMHAINIKNMFKEEGRDVISVRRYKSFILYTIAPPSSDLY